MTKLNVDHQLKDDDERLILLLREQAENYSEDLAEKTLSRILTEQAERRITFKPLKIPLYLMSAIILLLILPSVAPGVTDSLDVNFLPDFLIYSDIPIVRYTLVSWLVVIGLWISSLVISTHKSQLNTFNS